MILIQGLDNPDFLKKRDFRLNLIVDQDNPILIEKAWRDHFAGERFLEKGRGWRESVLTPESQDTFSLFES